MSGGKSSATKNSCFVQNSVENIYNRLNFDTIMLQFIFGIIPAAGFAVLHVRASTGEETTLIARFMGPTWGPQGDRHDPGGPHVGPMNLVIWEWLDLIAYKYGTSTWMFEYSKDVFKNGLQMNISLLTTIHEMKALLYTIHEGNKCF